MKRINITSGRIIGMALVLLLILAMPFGAMAQQNKQENRRRHFSPEEFQKHQREYITSKAGLTQEEADAFFPLFFELQNKKFELERNTRKEISVRKHQEMNEEQCRTFVNKMAELKIEIAKLEKEYTEKYLNVLPACKLMRVQHAENSFQRDLMKRMMRRHDNDGKNGNRRETKR